MTVVELVSEIEGDSKQKAVKFTNLLFALTLDLQVAMAGSYDEYFIFCHRHVCANYDDPPTEQKSIDGASVESDFVNVLLNVLNRAIEICLADKTTNYRDIFPVLKSVQTLITKFYIEVFIHGESNHKRERIQSFFAHFGATKFGLFSMEFDRWTYDQMKAGVIHYDPTRTALIEGLPPIAREVYDKLEEVGKRMTRDEIAKVSGKSPNTVSKMLELLIGYELVIHLNHGGYVVSK